MSLAQGTYGGILDVHNLYEKYYGSRGYVSRSGMLLKIVLRGRYLSPEVACCLNITKGRYKDALLVDMTMGTRVGDTRLPHDVLFAYKRR